MAASLAHVGVCVCVGVRSRERFRDQLHTTTLLLSLLLLPIAKPEDATCNLPYLRSMRFYFYFIFLFFLSCFPSLSRNAWFAVARYHYLSYYTTAPVFE